MIRLAKLTDYALVLLASFSREGDSVRAARDLAQATRLPLPTVSKILKALTRGGLVESLRGIKGGYRLARPASDISVADVIATMEGPIGLTDCAVGQSCEFETGCPMKAQWKRINRAVRRALEGLSLLDMAHPAGDAEHDDHGRGAGPVPTLTLLTKQRQGRGGH